MEGREYSSAGNDPSSNDHADYDYYSDDEEEYDLLSEGDATYVIQVPKDQIYRVPPPENALIAEQYRTAVPTRKTCFSINCMLVSTLIIILFISFITMASLTVADKKDPTFRIRRIHVITKGKGNKKEHELRFTLRSKNPNDRAVINFEKGGKSLLSFREKPFAKGKFPLSKEDSGSIESMKVKLTSGPKKKIPKEIQKSFDGKSHRPIKLSLKFRVPVKFTVGLFPVKNKELSIVCHLKVNKLTKNARVLRQECDYLTS